MASIISAGTSAGTAIAISGDTSGNLSFQTQAGANTITVPNATGTVMVSGNMPAFSANISTQSVSSDTATLMAYANEYFDTNSCYNNTGSTVGGIPAYSFLPNVAGYYQVTMSSYWASYNGGGFVNIALYKNGSGYTEYSRINATSGTMNGSGLVYLNGTTDYIGAYWYSASGTCTLVGSNGSFFSNFSATLVRGA
jgi:hypothetical protein